METQTNFPGESEKPGSSQQREGTEEEKKDINVDDTASQKKPVTLEDYGQDISGHEADSILSDLKNCFKDGYHGEWAGFYNQGFPAFTSSRHMMWHKQFWQTKKPHDDHWYHDTEETF